MLILAKSNDMLPNYFLFKKTLIRASIWAVTHKLTLNYRSKTATLICIGQFYQNL